MKSTNIKDSSSPAENYLNHLKSIFQQEPEYHYLNENSVKQIPGVTSIIYQATQKKGFITGLTYGLSIVEHPQWKLSRPELCITVKSDKKAWVHTAAHIANNLRGICPFRYGEIINFGKQISEDSEMDAFFIFAPSILNSSSYTKINIGTVYQISIAGLYPIYSSEIEILDQIGLEAFWHHTDFDLYDVNRKRIEI